MSAPRWTLGEAFGGGGSKRIIRRDGKVALVLSADRSIAPELTALSRRIVSLLNATELTSDAVATLQAACMAEAALDRDLAAEFSHADPEQQQRIATLDALTDTLNHTVRLYAELDEEPSIALDKH